MSNRLFLSLYLLDNIHNVSDKYIVIICHANIISSHIAQTLSLCLCRS